MLPPPREPDFDFGPNIPESILKELDGGFLEGAEAVLLVPERDQPWLYRAFYWEKKPKKGGAA